MPLRSILLKPTNKRCLWCRLRRWWKHRRDNPFAPKNIHRAYCPRPTRKPLNPNNN